MFDYTYPIALLISITWIELTFSIFFNFSSKLSSSCSSGHAKKAIMAFSPKAMGSSSNLQFFPLFYSMSNLALSFTFSKSVSGDVGINFILTAAIPIFLLNQFLL